MPGFAFPPPIPHPRPSTPASPTPTTMPPLPVVPSHWTFPADRLTPKRARREVAAALPGTYDPQLTDDLGLLASELVTNAYLHGPQPAEDHMINLALWPADGHYWLAVSDAGHSDLPTLTSPRLGACSGRGLLLIDAISSTWGVVPRPYAGKSVIAGIRLDPT